MYLAPQASPRIQYPPEASGFPVEQTRLSLLVRVSRIRTGLKSSCIPRLSSLSTFSVLEEHKKQACNKT